MKQITISPSTGKIIITDSSGDISGQGSIRVVWDGQTIDAYDAITGDKWSMYVDADGIIAISTKGTKVLSGGKITEEVEK